MRSPQYIFSAMMLLFLSWLSCFAAENQALLPEISPHILSFDPAKGARKLGEGTYAKVWLAIDGKGNKFAVKIFDSLEEYEIEAQIYARIREQEHPNLVTAFGHTVVQGSSIAIAQAYSHAIVMEYMDGDLSDLLIRRKLSLKERLRIVEDTAAALNHLHSSIGAVHADLKPANILYRFSPQGKLVYKVSDFSLVQWLAPEAKADLGETELVSTWWRAPELCLGGHFDHYIDIWSLGAIFAELLSGKILTQGNSDLNQFIAICTLSGFPTDSSWQGVSARPRYKEFARCCQTLPLQSNGLATAVQASAMFQRMMPARHAFRGSASPLEESIIYLLRRMLESCPESRINAKEIYDYMERFRLRA